MNDPITKEKLEIALRAYFNIGDSYTFELTRDKSAFNIGTISVDDFQEFDATNVSDLADYLMKTLYGG